ncbi:MAG: DUF459 domain-containing protein [Verrucomicrobiota bacterium]|jgi:hypothetical protein|nr:DUF459 domain-containing protein [Verrucomicrobiota bacterium]
MRFNWIVLCLVLVFGLAVPASFAELPGARSPVLLIGDSMMKLPGLAMERELSKLPDVQATTFSGIGTGLARLDAFDWLEKMRDMCAEYHPNVVVVALGANDRQPMQSASGTILQTGTPEWDAEYARRVGEAMDILLDGGCRQVIWLLLPPMRDAVANTFAEKVNATILAEAEKRPAVLPYDFSPLVVNRRTGAYTERIMDPKTAASVKIRDNDGIHLAPDGARLLSTKLIQDFWK